MKLNVTNRMLLRQRITGYSSSSASSSSGIDIVEEIENNIRGR